jgi:uncharacterized protein (DUF1778 family)
MEPVAKPVQHARVDAKVTIEERAELSRAAQLAGTTVSGILAFAARDVLKRLKAGTISSNSFAPDKRRRANG